ncbi:MAG: hypothetical protein JWL64_220 [Frankiales bacterium]|nr:hypothetical protein [Frankiales bacterium]
MDTHALLFDGWVDFALLLFRVTLGGMIAMHGYNHLYGPGGVDGTARWFGSMGFHPARVHALMSGYTELAAGASLILGLFTPLGAAALIGTMSVAGWVAHRPNGFFIFKDGYEYVLVVAVAALTLATVGPGALSLDYAFGIVDYTDSSSLGLAGMTGFLIALVGGLGGAIGLLVTGWKPVPKTPPAPPAATAVPDDQV